MRIEILGCDGGPGPGRYPMSLLVGGRLLVDAGSALSGMDPGRLPGVEAVLVSHGHLDHIRELGFIPFHRDPDRDGLLEVCGVAAVLETVRTAVFNDDFWIDFESPRPPRKAGIRYRVLEWERPVEVAGIGVEAVRLTHSRYETSGFLLEEGGVSVVYALDSGPTRRIWERARTRERIGGVFLDVSFPDRFREYLDEHNTPSGVRAELEKARPHAPRVFATHLKPEYRIETASEIEALPFAVELPGAGDVLEL